jgi:hypothetical protein
VDIKKKMDNETINMIIKIKDINENYFNEIKTLFKQAKLEEYQNINTFTKIKERNFEIINIKKDIEKEIKEINNNDVLKEYETLQEQFYNNHKKYNILETHYNNIHNLINFYSSSSFILLKNQIIIFGGSKNEFSTNDLVIFNTLNNESSKIKIKSKKYSSKELEIIPSPRTQHSMVYFNDYIYVFGGRSSIYSIEFPKYTLWRFSTFNYEWEAIDEDCDIILSRYLHTTEVFENKIIVYGGVVNGTTISHEMIYYDLLNCKWGYIDKGEEGGIFGHSSFLYQDKMYILGGCDEKLRVKNEFKRYDFVKKEWKKIGDVGYMKYQSSYFDAENLKYYVYGGKNEKGEILNDLKFFDLNNDDWKKIDLFKYFEKRIWNLIYVNNNFFYLFGGCDQDFENYNNYLKINFEN